MPKAVRRPPIPGRTRRTPPRTAGSGGSLMRRAACSASPRCSATAPPEASSRPLAEIQRPGCSRPRSDWRVGAEQAVQDAVPPGAAAPSDSAHHAFAGEPGLLECPLLGDVVRLGPGFDPVSRRVREQVSREQAVRPGAVAAAAGMREHDYADLPAVCGRGGRSPPPVHQTETVVLARHDKRSAVRANQPVVRPASPPAPQVVPAEPLMLPGRLRILGQRLKHGYVALADKPQFQLIAHESDRDTCEGSPPGASSCRAVDPGTDTNIEGRSRDPPGC